MPAQKTIPTCSCGGSLRHRAQTIYVGPERPDNADAFDECRLGKAGDVLPTLFDV